MLPGQHVATVSAFVIQGLAVAKEFCLILMEVGDNIIRMNMLFFLLFFRDFDTYLVHFSRNMSTSLKKEVPITS